MVRIFEMCIYAVCQVLTFKPFAQGKLLNRDQKASLDFEEKVTAHT